MALRPQQVRGVDEEPGDTVLTRVFEHVPVPPRAVDAGAVARRRGQAPVGPRHPGRGDLDPGQAAQRRVVDRRRSPVEVERGHVPGTAHHGDGLVTVLDRPPDRSTHVSLATFLVGGGDRPRTCGDHRLGDGVERGGAVAAMLDHVLPPALRVTVARCGGELAERIGRCGVGHQFVGPLCSERHGHRQVDRRDRPVVSVRPRDRLPLGAERGERCKDRSAGFVGHVAEQRDGRNQAGTADPSETRFDVGGRLDEQDVGTQLVERADDRPRRSGPVVSDAEQVDGHLTSHLAGPSRLTIPPDHPAGPSRARTIPGDHLGDDLGRPSENTGVTSRGRGRLRRTRPSPAARAPHLRGTRATPRHRGSDR